MRVMIFLHIIGGGRIDRDDGVQGRVHPQRIVGRRHGRRLFGVVPGQVGEQGPDGVERLVFIFGGEMGHPTDGCMGHRPTQGLHIDHFTGDRFDHFRAGNEHVADPLGHDDEIGDSRRIDRAARAGTQLDADLGNHPAGQRVAVEQLTESPQGEHAFLDARAAAIAEPDDRDASLHGHIHDLEHLLAGDLAEGAPKDGEIRGVQADAPPVNFGEPGDHPVPWDAVFLHAKIAVAVKHESIDLLE